jgi:hypothetical protein
MTPSMSRRQSYRLGMAAAALKTSRVDPEAAKRWQ